MFRLLVIIKDSSIVLLLLCIALGANGAAPGIKKKQNKQTSSLLIN